MKQVIVTGEIKSMEPNDKEGLSLRVRSVHKDGKGSNLEFFEIYGKYAEVLKEKNVISVGDIVSITYEEVTKQKTDPETGITDKWVTYKNDVTITRTYRPNSNSSVNASAEVSAPEGLDPENY